MRFGSASSQLLKLVHQHRKSVGTITSLTSISILHSSNDISLLESDQLAPKSPTKIGFDSKEIDLKRKKCNDDDILSLRVTNKQLKNSRNEHNYVKSISNSNVHNAGTLTKNWGKEVIVDFVIIGLGSAGKAALQTLQKLSPTSTVAVVDPISHSLQSTSSSFQKSNTLHFSSSAIGINHEDQVVHLQDGSTLTYKNSVLLSTGSRGAPPPESLIENKALDRILELKSTSATTLHSLISSNSNISKKQDSLNNSNSLMQTNMNERRLPILPPHFVRRIGLLAASQGGHVTIIGSGLEALELAVSISSATMNEKTKSNGSKTGNTTLIFGNSSPLPSLIPSYLKTALMNRLKHCGIDVNSRTLIRYVSHQSSSSVIGKDKDIKNLLHTNQDYQIPKLEVHLSKSYDTLDTKRFLSDLMIVAPTTHGKHGTAVIPIPTQNYQHSNHGYNTTVEDMDVNDALSSHAKRITYKAWSHLVSNNVVNCYSNDGRIVVNAELLAASGIYAAGSVARYPNDNNTGTAVVAGDDVYNAAIAGEIAAQNMIRDYEKRKYSHKKFITNRSYSIPQFSDESLPLLRTDVCTYDGNRAKTRSLESIGIHALCIGNCDSENMTTHGFWWTNQANDLRKARHRNSNKDKRNDSIQRRATSSGSVLKRPVYGIGIVYYLNQDGKICGIMTWGVPFTESYKSSNLNKDLLNRIKLLIQTNGEIAISSLKVDGDNNLEVSHLAQESRYLLSLVCASEALTAKPLHRYTPSKPSHIGNLGSLKRNKGNYGSDEHCFMRRMKSDQDEKDGFDHRPPSLIHVYPMEQNGNFLSLSNQRKDFDVSNERSRPQKEDPLWLYQSEQHKSMSVKDVMGNIFIQNLKRGKFSDGSDAFNAPPLPKSIQNVARTVKQWTNNEIVEETDTNDEDQNVVNEENTQN